MGDTGEEAVRERPKQHYGSVPWEPGKSRVEPETLAYLTEVSEHLATIEDAEEKELLLNNVLEELEGKELRIAADAVSSRLLETLLAPAAPRHLISFMGAFTSEDDMYKLAGSAFGSHVAEALLERLGAAADAGLADGDAAALAGLLDSLAGALGDQMYDYLMDRHATHVARALLRVAAGCDVVPASKQGKQKKQDRAEGGGGGAAAAGRQHGAGGGKGLDPLAEKLAGSHKAEQPPPRFPALLSRLARMLPCYDPPSMATLAKNTYSGPFLQGMLRAVAGDSALLNQVLPPMLGVSAAAAAEAAPGSVLASVTESHMSKLLRDDVYSRLLEVVLAVAPPRLWSEFHERFLKGRLMALTSHHAANFVVQAALAGAQGKQQVTALFEELQNFLGPLLLKRRSGVIAALVAACGRAGVCQREVCAALAKALASLPQWQGREGTSFLAPALMTLDTEAVLGGAGRAAADDSVKLSTPGCALLAAILGFPKNASRDFAASVAALSPADAARCASDAAGSRALEALLTGPAAVQTKKELLGKLEGSWGKVAGKAPGSFLVERAYAWGELDVKEAIVAGVAANSQQLQHCYWWTRLSRALGVEAYQRSADEWRKRAQSQAATKRAYDQLFGGEGGGGGGGGEGGGGGSKKKQRKDRRQGAEQQDGAQQQERDEGAAPRGRGREEQQEQEEQQRAAKKRKGPKHQHEGEQQEPQVAAAAADGGGDDEAAGRKGKRKKQQRERDGGGGDGGEGQQHAAAAGGGGKKAKHTPDAAAAPAEEAAAKKSTKKKDKAAAGGGAGGQSVDGIMAMLGFGAGAPAAAAAAVPGGKAKQGKKRKA